MTDSLPAPTLTKIFRLDAELGVPVDLGERDGRRRRIVPLTGGAVTGAIAGTLIPEGSADWQTVLADGTAFGDIRCTLRTGRGQILLVRSRGVRHGDPDVLARLSRGEDVSPTTYTFRTSTEIETTSVEFDWLNKGVFISVAGRQPEGVTYEVYLVG
jgi:hypothetical protein